MSRRRIGVLYEVWWPSERAELTRTLAGERPPDVDADGEPIPQPDVHDEVYHALGRLGHLPQFCVLEGDRQSLDKLARSRTSLIFNLTESYRGDDTMDLHVAAYLDLIGKPYTGSGPRALHLGQDKALAKKVLRYHGVSTPDFFTVSREQLKRSIDLPFGFPMIVKPSREDGSIGIDAGSVVYDEASLRTRIRYVTHEFDGPALVERFIEGREFYVAVVGNDRPKALPLVELDLRKVPKGVPRIAGTEVKWWTGSKLYRDTPPVYPKNVGRELTRSIQTVALGAYRALGLRDYGRVDLRVTSRGVPYVIEVNPNPWIATGCEFFMAWQKTGKSYDELIETILKLALARYGL